MSPLRRKTRLTQAADSAVMLSCMHARQCASPLLESPLPPPLPLPLLVRSYDVFSNIRDDEGEHVKTMRACQDRTVMRELAFRRDNPRSV